MSGSSGSPRSIDRVRCRRLLGDASAGATGAIGITGSETILGGREAHDPSAGAGTSLLVVEPIIAIWASGGEGGAWAGDSRLLGCSDMARGSTGPAGGGLLHGRATGTEPAVGLERTPVAAAVPGPHGGPPPSIVSVVRCNCKLSLLYHAPHPS